MNATMSGRRSPLARLLSTVALFAVAGCGAAPDPAFGVDDNGGYVDIDGHKNYLVPADDQKWDGLGAGEYDPDPVFGQTLPDMVDHAAFQTPIRDQQSNLTCVDFATVAGMEAFAHFQPMASDLSEGHLASLHSAKTLQATLQAAAAFKLTTEADWPSGAAAGNAGWQTHALYGILEWKAILNPTDIDGLRARIAEGDKTNVILSMSHVGVAWKLNGKVEPVAGPTESWAHAVLLVGYKKMQSANLQSKWFFHIKNSWGTTWGESGYGWLSEDYVKAHGLQAAVVRSVTSSTPGGNCAPNASKACVGGNVYNFDSCGGQGTLAASCDDGNPCTNDGCSNGTCQHSAAQDGAPCGSGKACEGGVCKGTCTPNLTTDCSGGNVYHFDSCGNKGALAESCDDGNECTTDGCAQGACQHVAAPNGKPCVGGACLNGLCGQCQAGASKKCVGGDVYSFDSCGNQGPLFQSCNDANPCTADGCALGACQHAALQDGTVCGSGKACAAGSCGCLPAASKKCVNGSSYWFDSCGAQGPLAEACDDGNACTTDGCAGGACTHVNVQDGLACSAGKVCTQGACVAAGCTANASQKCVNGNLYYFDSCGGQGALATSCDDGKACTTDGCTGSSCTHVNLPDNTVCGVGLVCTAGACGAPPCSPTANTTCANGNVYHIDSCGKTGALAEACDDGNPCTIDGCSSNACTHTPVGDNTSCGLNQVCISGVCTSCTQNATKKCVNGNLYWFDSCGAQGSLAQSCDDGNPCTTDSCPSTTCQHANLPDNTPCGGTNVCTAGACGPPPCLPNKTQKCANGNVYWFDSCDVQGSLVQSCDDGNPCTIDSCPSTSCQHTNATNGTSCGSGKTCSNGVCVDACNNGICASTENPVSCPGDCAPQFVDVQELGTTLPSGGCSSVNAGWHPAGGIVYWTFGTSCTTPSPQSAGSYNSEYGRWRFDIKKAGTYNVAFKIPPTGAACGFATTKYTTGARYALVNGSTAVSAVVNQRNAVGAETIAFSNVYLVPGPLYLYLYDSVTDLSNCCASCGQSIRVFLDYATVVWVGP